LDSIATGVLAEMGSLKHLLASMAFAITAARAQTVLKPEVLSSFIYTMYGDRTPFVLPQDPVLTPLGARQLYNAGSNFRARYITATTDTGDDGDATIRNISPYQLVPGEITVLSTDDQYVTASAQAFVQGLYPPLSTSSNYTYITGQSPLANGTNVIAPLDGYQYANIQSPSGNDLNSIWAQGSHNCPAYGAATAEYYQSPGFAALQVSTDEFYDSLEPEFLSGVFSNASVGYFDAYYIWDYLNYEYIHNTTVAENLDATEVTRVKVLAADWVYAMNANVSLSGNNKGDHIGVIAGRTLAARILQAFYTTINTQGDSDKMTLLFGSFEPMIAFAALAELVSPQNAAFYNLPEPGSSFMFELFALRDNDIGTYPDLNEMYVRFLYQNGTEDFSTAVEYPLFGRSPSQTVMSLADFISGIERIMVYNVEDWCTTCSSYSIFCPAFTNTDSSFNQNSGHRGLNPTVAGVIGAIVALVVFGLIIAAAMLLGGCRLQRVHKKRRSELGGFKGAEKLASDQDLTIPKGSAGAVITEPGPTYVRGHERVGSWELRDQAKAEEAQRAAMAGNLHAKLRRPSFEEDDLNVTPYNAPVKPHDHV
jgi:Histidine phosphatase superfamily (branch 2)